MMIEKNGDDGDDDADNTEEDIDDDDNGLKDDDHRNHDSDDKVVVTCVLVSFDIKNPTRLFASYLEYEVILAFYVTHINFNCHLFPLIIVVSTSQLASQSAS